MLSPCTNTVMGSLSHFEHCLTTLHGSSLQHHLSVIMARVVKEGDTVMFVAEAGAKKQLVTILSGRYTRRKQELCAPLAAARFTSGT